MCIRDRYRIKKGRKAVLYLVLTVMLLIGIYLYAATQVSQTTNAAQVSASSTIKMPDKLAVGGESFGVKFFTKGVVIVGTNDIITENGSKNPAKDAGIQVKDIILKIDGTEIESNEQISEIVSACSGKTLEIVYRRENSECTACVKPELDKDLSLIHIFRRSFRMFGKFLYLPGKNFEKRKNPAWHHRCS